MMVAKNSDIDYQTIRTIEGLPVHGDVGMKILMVGDEMIMLEIHYAEESGSPVHKRRHESLCYVVKGKIRATVEGETSILGVGDSCRHPEGAIHSVDAYEGDATIVEIKSPVQDIAEVLGIVD